MGRKAAHLIMQDEFRQQFENSYQGNFSAATAILLRIAARIDAPQSAAMETGATQDANFSTANGMSYLVGFSDGDIQ